jgi:hypothetical protein
MRRSRSALLRGRHGWRHLPEGLDCNDDDTCEGEPCGAVGLACCTGCGQECFGGADCVDDVCEMAEEQDDCGGNGDPCCEDDMCFGQLECNDDGSAKTIELKRLEVVGEHAGGLPTAVEMREAFLDAKASLEEQIERLEIAVCRTQLEPL